MVYDFTPQPRDPVSDVDGFPSRTVFESRTRAERGSGVATFSPLRGPSKGHDAAYREADAATEAAYQAWQVANDAGTTLRAEHERADSAVRSFLAAAGQREPLPDDDYQLRVLQREARAAATAVDAQGRVALKALREYDRLVLEAQIRGDLRSWAWERTITANDAVSATWATFTAAFDEREKLWAMAGAPGRDHHWNRLGGGSTWSMARAAIAETLRHFPDLRRLTPDNGGEASR